MLRIFSKSRKGDEIYPQVLNMGLDYDWQASDSVDRIINNEPLHFVPNLDTFDLDPDAMLTDVVSQGYIYTQGLLLSRNLVNIINSFVLPNRTLFNATVSHNKTISKYFWFHVTERTEKYIDFENSDFYLKEEDSQNLVLKKISGFDELKDLCRDLVSQMSGELFANKIQFMTETPHYDLFFLQLTSRYIFISESLAATLKNQRFTGFDLIPSKVIVSFP